MTRRFITRVRALICRHLVERIKPYLPTHIPNESSLLGSSTWKAFPLTA
jgi:hypothetical protein